MPDPTDVPELVDALKQFTKDHKAFVASREGLRTLTVLKAFSRGVRAAGTDAVLGKTAAPDAQATMAWLSRMPQVFLGHARAPFIDLERMEPKVRSKTVAAALQALAVGSKALLLGGGGKDRDNESLAQAVLHVAFGADSAASALRTAMVDPRWPLPPGWKWPDHARLADLVLAGTVREMLQTFARCGVSAQEDRNQTRLEMTYGHVDSLTPPRACAGQSLEVAFSSFGNLPAPGSDVCLSIPTSHGCVRFAFSRIDPGLLTAGGWRSSGVVRVTLPNSVFTGWVGFFLTPPPPDSIGGCEAGALAGAAGMLQSLLGEVLGPAGVLTGQVILNVANHVEAARFQAVPCASRQNDGLNRLLAGPPVIERFKLVEDGPVHPRGTVTLEWAVGNADDVTIVRRAVAGSETPHELPPVPLLLPMSGRITLPAPCTTRWEAEYVLEATNGNNCSQTPVTQAVPIRSGFSHWMLGVGRADITDRRPGLRMAGFTYEQQTTSGEVQKDVAGNELPLYARASYIGENRVLAERQELVVVVADIWTCTIVVKQAVVTALNDRFRRPGEPDRFNDANVMIAGTHTHAAPGGYSDYALYNLTNGGFDDTVFRTIVAGIASAAAEAVRSAQPGRLFVNAGEVPDCGANRSMPAFERNPEAAAGADTLDRSMLLLKLVADTNNRGGSSDIGAVNWYAMHPTSLGMFNRMVSGDNKGWAEMLFEREMARRGKRVIAAFGNANGADVSGNYVRDIFGNPEFRRPLGGEMPEGASFPPRIANPADTVTDILNMKAIGQKQYEKALALFDDPAASEVTGRLAMKHAFVDMSDVPIAAVPNARTWPAAVGVSFGAGSSEDSIAYVTMGGFDIDAGIPEGVTLAVNVLGAVTAVVVASTMVVVSVPGATQLIPGLLATLLAGAPLPAAAVRLLLPLAAALIFPPSRAFIAARIGAASLPRKIPLPRANEGSGEWFLPVFVDYPPGYETGHGEKPIMFPLGFARVSFTPSAASRFPELTRAACPLVPHVVPMHLVRIGGVVLAGVPAEFTAMAGRRLKQTLATAFGAGMSHCAIAGYCNGYSGYVTTREEYGAQHYEGASTLYGEFTLMAYQQTFSAMADAVNGAPDVIPAGASFPVPLVVARS